MFHIDIHSITKHITLALLCATTAAHAQTAADSCMTLDNVIRRAQEQSCGCSERQACFLAAEWQYKYYKANYLPSVSLTSSPFLNREINKITLNDGTSAFIKQNQLSTDLSLTVNQNIALTGGSLFLKSSLARIDEFEHDKTSYRLQSCNYRIQAEPFWIQLSEMGPQNRTGEISRGPEKLQRSHGAWLPHTHALIFSRS